MTARIRQVVAAILATLTPALVAPTGAAAVGVGQTCGSVYGFVCDRGLWCSWPAGNCTAADIPGKCVEIPAVCAKNYRPICGCDKRTYGNDCERVYARVQKDHDGPCK